MNLLIISYWYEPDLSPRAFRWTTLAEHWARQGHHVDVLSAGRPGSPRFELQNGVLVHRVGGRLTNAVRARLKRTSPRRPDANSHEEPPIAKAADIARWIHDRAWKSVYWPDYACGWYLPALRQARRLRKFHHYDAVISVSQPFTGHLVGLGLVQDDSPSRWIMDIGEPFSFSQSAPLNNRQLYREWNSRWEQRALERADAVTLPTERMQQTYKMYFPGLGRKLYQVPPLASLADGPECAEPFFPDDDRIRLVFLGTLYQTTRSPQLLLALFQQLLRGRLANRLELHFVGQTNDCEEALAPHRELLGRRIFLHGKVDRPRAQRALHEADVLVNIGDALAYQLPSKVVEYMSTGKPILNLATHAKDSSAELLAEYPGALCLWQSDFETGCDAMQRLVEFLGNPPRDIDQFTVERLLRPYRVAAIAAGYEDLLDRRIIRRLAA